MQIEFKEGGSVSDADLKRRGPTPKWTALVEAASRLRHKQHLRVPVPARRDPEKFRQSVRQALNRYVTGEVRSVKRFEVRLLAGAEPGVAVIAFCHRVEDRS